MNSKVVYWNIIRSSALNIIWVKLTRYSEIWAELTRHFWIWIFKRHGRAQLKFRSDVWAQLRFSSMCKLNSDNIYYRWSNYISIHNFAIPLIRYTKTNKHNSTHISIYSLNTHKQTFSHTHAHTCQQTHGLESRYRINRVSVVETDVRQTRQRLTAGRMRSTTQF